MNRKQTHLIRLRPLLAIILLNCLLLPSTGRAKILKTTKGTISPGGSIIIDVRHVEPEGVEGRTGGVLDISPIFEYFIADNVAFRIGATFAMAFGELYEEPYKMCGGFFGFQYYFNFFHRVVPYTGLFFGPRVVISENGRKYASMGIGLWLGMSIALNKHLAVSIGITPRVFAGLGNFNSIMVEIPIGYFGVSAFW